MIKNIPTPLVSFAGSGVAGFFVGIFLRRVLKDEKSNREQIWQFFDDKIPAAFFVSGNRSQMLSYNSCPCNQVQKFLSDSGVCPHKEFSLQLNMVLSRCAFMC